MSRNNIEIKARVRNINSIRNHLKKLKADFKGIDHQKDTYFKVDSGRLKLREGNIENNLIFYDRKNQQGPKLSKVILVKISPDSKIKELLNSVFESFITVDKKREIYFVDNVKFHIDSVRGLGKFIEIEAIDYTGAMPLTKLKNQCNKYINLFNINKCDMISESYSDMMFNKNL